MGIETVSFSDGIFSAFSGQHASKDDLILASGSQKVIEMNQVHGIHVEEVFSETLSPISDSDGTFTFEKDLALIVRIADCLPIFVYHPVGMIAAIHAGRKGTQNEILGRFCINMKEKHGLFSGFKFYFGPCICESCYEINPETGETFGLMNENEKQIHAAFGHDGYTLIRSPHCTVCDQPKFFSYRANQKTEKRNFGIIQRRI